MGKVVQVKSGYSAVALPPLGLPLDAGQSKTLTDAEYAGLSSPTLNAVTVIQAGVADPVRSGNYSPLNLADAVAQSVLAVAQSGAYLPRKVAARNPDLLITGAVTRDANGAAISAPVTWPDGTVGTYTADTVSTAFPGAVDGYHITYGSGPVINTYTQPTITRDATSGAATNVPAIVVT